MSTLDVHDLLHDLLGRLRWRVMLRRRAVERRVGHPGVGDHLDHLDALTGDVTTGRGFDQWGGPIARSGASVDEAALDPDRTAVGWTGSGFPPRHVLAGSPVRPRRRPRSPAARALT